jgi:hypothetical protein
MAFPFAAAAAAARVAAIRLAKPAAIATGGWLVKKYGDKLADDGYDRVKDKASRASADKHHETLAQDLARARGWTYQPFVVDGAPRYVVWSEDKKPIAAFPQVDDAHTPEALADCVELKGYVPDDTDLLRPPAKPSGAKPAG